MAAIGFDQVLGIHGAAMVINQMHGHLLIGRQLVKPERPGTVCRRLVAAEPGTVGSPPAVTLPGRTVWDTGDGWVAISVRSVAGCGVLSSHCAAARTPGLMASRAVRRWKYSTPLSCVPLGGTST